MMAYKRLEAEHCIVFTPAFHGSKYLALRSDHFTPMEEVLWYLFPGRLDGSQRLSENGGKQKNS
jgi:hypothetical protein